MKKIFWVFVGVSILFGVGVFFSSRSTPLSKPFSKWDGVYSVQSGSLKSPLLQPLTIVVVTDNLSREGLYFLRLRVCTTKDIQRIVMALNDPETRSPQSVNGQDALLLFCVNRNLEILKPVWVDIEFDHTAREVIFVRGRSKLLYELLTGIEPCENYYGNINISDEKEALLPEHQEEMQKMVEEKRKQKDQQKGKP